MRIVFLPTAIVSGKCGKWQGGEYASRLAGFFRQAAAHPRTMKGKLLAAAAKALIRRADMRIVGLSGTETA
jgi:hypothetical protein